MTAARARPVRWLALGLLAALVGLAAWQVDGRVAAAVGHSTGVGLASAAGLAAAAALLALGQRWAPRGFASGSVRAIVTIASLVVAWGAYYSITYPHVVGTAMRLPFRQG